MQSDNKEQWICKVFVIGLSEVVLRNLCVLVCTSDCRTNQTLQMFSSYHIVDRGSQNQADSQQVFCHVAIPRAYV